jgi:hypothetical protein
VYKHFDRTYQKTRDTPAIALAIANSGPLPASLHPLGEFIDRLLS